MRITLFVAALLLLVAGVALSYLDKTGGASATYAAAVICLIFVFLDQFKRFKGFGVEAELKDFQAKFGKEINKLESEAKVLPPLPEPRPKGMRLPPPPGYRSRFDRLADISPRGAIIEAWREVENAVQAATPDRDMKEKMGAPPPVVIARSFAAQGLIDERTHIIFEELLDLRNRAAHVTEFQPSTEQAKEFVRLAFDIAKRF